MLAQANVGRIIEDHPAPLAIWIHEENVVDVINEIFVLEKTMWYGNEITIKKPTGLCMYQLLSLTH